MSAKKAVPNCLKDTLSLKKLTLHNLDILAKVINDNENDVQVLLLTPFGFIKGDIADVATKATYLSNTEDSKVVSVDISYAIEMRNETIIDWESNGDILTPFDNGAAINLKNVSVYKDNLTNPVITTNQMVVFVDQVISFSLIPRNHDQE